MCESPIELFLLNLFFNWRILALHCFAGFCHTTTQLSHNYTYIFPPEPPSPPPTHPLGHHREEAEPLLHSNFPLALISHGGV